MGFHSTFKTAWINSVVRKEGSEKKGFCGYTIKTVIPVIENRQDVGVASPSKVRCVSFFFLLVSAES